MSQSFGTVDEQNSVDCAVNDRGQQAVARDSLQPRENGVVPAADVVGAQRSLWKDNSNSILSVQFSLCTENGMIRIYLCLLLFTRMYMNIGAASPQITEALENLFPSHPRLFLNAAEEPAWRTRIEQNETLRSFADRVIENAEGILETAPVTRELEGRRLLGVSRTVLKRTVHLSMAYRLTGEKKYADRAILEMKTAAGFTDWNPSHFLDVAEMTAALAVGYDWLFAEMTPAERELISTAILDKGLHPSLPDPDTGKEQGWVNGNNNWNQVCHAGMTLGALAVYERDPALAERILERAVKGLPNVMKTYAPDGAYVEGATYWSYGTTFNVLFLDAVEHALGTDFGLSAMPGFLESSDYTQHISGPGGQYFNYADSGLKPAPQPAMYWMSAKRNQPSLLWLELDLIDRYVHEAPSKNKSSNRLTPFILLWTPEKFEKVKPEVTHWHADGEMPVAFHRSGWKPDATYVAIKGGSPSLNHAHMDVGTFVLEMNGVRWAVDLGSENYHEVEKRGFNLWSSKQDSDRWDIFRLSSFSHNILTVNGQQQRVTGNASIIRSTGSPENKTVVDLSPVYKGQLASALRSVSLIQPGQVLLEDQLGTLGQATRIRWAMLTNAEINLKDTRRALLKQNEKTLAVILDGLKDVKWQVKDVSHPPRDWESQNPDTRMLYFEADLPRDQETRYTVKFLGH